MYLLVVDFLECLLVQPQDKQDNLVALASFFQTQRLSLGYNPIKYKIWKMFDGLYGVGNWF